MWGAGDTVGHVQGYGSIELISAQRAVGLYSGKMEGGMQPYPAGLTVDSGPDDLGSNPASVAFHLTPDK